MAWQVISQGIPEVKLVIPNVFGDARGFFQETFHAEKYCEAGITVPFIQDNWSHSTKGTLRGLHYQLPNLQDKLVWVVSGEIFDVAVDVRRNSPTFGRWVGAILSSTNHYQFFVPAGFAHGFCVMSEEADFMYKCSAYYSPKDEKGILWSDPTLNIPWPVATPLLSKRDAGMNPLADVKTEDLPVYI